MPDWADININKRIHIYTNGIKNINITFPKSKLLSTRDNSDKNDTILIMNIKQHLLSNYKPQIPYYWKMQNDWSSFRGKYDNKNFLLVWGDETKKYSDMPLLCKVRLIEKSQSKVLMRFNYMRHWQFVNDVTKIRNYNNFNKKKSIIHWRGATTGEPPLQRHIVVSKYYNNKVCDIAYCHICQGFKLEKPEYYKKGYQTRKHMLENKYLLSIDGNDKASDLNWKLASDSLVFMCKPKYESWLMESKLIEWVHYVPIKRDYSDLIKKYEWAEQNPEKCIEIIKNANLFMDSNFKNIEKEKMIEREVLKYYLENVNITLK